MRLAFASALPLRLYVEVRLAGMPTISTLRVFVVNASRDCGSEDNCEEYTVEEVCYATGFQYYSEFENIMFRFYQMVQ